MTYSPFPLVCAADVRMVRKGAVDARIARLDAVVDATGTDITAHLASCGVYLPMVLSRATEEDRAMLEVLPWRLRIDGVPVWAPRARNPWGMTIWDLMPDDAARLTELAVAHQSARRDRADHEVLGFTAQDAECPITMAILDADVEVSDEEVAAMVSAEFAEDVEDGYVCDPTSADELVAYYLGEAPEAPAPPATSVASSSERATAELQRREENRRRKAAGLPRIEGDPVMLPLSRSELRALAA